MPTPLPVKLRAQASARARVASHASAKASDDHHGLGVWAILVGLAALAVATMAYLTNGDQVGAAGILVAAAIVIALLSRSAEDDVK